MFLRLMQAVLGLTLLGAAYVVVTMTVAGDRRMLLSGETTHAHHQLEMACETCHGRSVFADAKAAQKALNKNCRKCHEDELKAAKDSHSRKRFRNPRMAEYWDKLDARQCTPCHIEHRPEITRESAVTVAMDFCVACHSQGEQDIRTTRASHAGLGFETCATAGCHNFHDNRALFEDFLLGHAGQPEPTRPAVHGLTARYRARPVSTDKALQPGDAVAPPDALAEPGALQHWAGSGHARAGVNCTACHAADAAKDAPSSQALAHWIDAPPMRVCMECHKPQAKTFVLGRHGMRQHPGIAKPRDLPGWMGRWLGDPGLPVRMTVGEARLPMRADAHPAMAVDCASCHTEHALDTAHAALEACASCHDDAHTRSYFDSPHHVLWQREQAGEAPPGSSVSCASCHMPKLEHRKKVRTTHNQNDNLRPNEKMIRSVCLDCHSLGFSLEALADPKLIRNNFTGPPGVRVHSIDWAIARSRNPEAPED
ncbi:MAG: NrfA- nitrite reduction protein [Proteobacteria bacterium]|nr:NrfA- nitrite reduction protein [Pseudomonadota bacterium]